MVAKGGGGVVRTFSTEGEMVFESIPSGGLCLVAAGEEDPSEDTGEVLYGAVKLERK